MNKARRKRVSDIAERLDGLREEIECILDEEIEAHQNLPVALQSSNRGEAMEEAIEHLDDALSAIDEATLALSEIMELS